ncbi:shikimate dehydrogenase family protein [Chachezhania antarctica]|uniref:shikimate dehydrogenase family protein n=1 Tax=Chachezhania antarctica TaxID=2340860 RepID=UPI000EADA62B|nr:shikimate dehydrogenase [Chachezhania antarctica]|tara:strand:- start:11405 stop:12181 length:777 start_codon:yes stop_codon:yes gene_type:complete
MGLTSAGVFAFMIGDPVAQTVMPGVVNTRLANSDAVMVPVHLPPVGLARFVESVRDMKNCRGFVATAPHKLPLVGMVDRVTDAAELCGAVNIVLRGDDGVLIGDNIDGPGFVTALESKGFVVAERRAVIFGCGGAGASIAWALAEGGIKDLALIDTDDAKVDTIRARLGGPCRSGAPGDIAATDLVVNATSIGLDGVSMVDPLDDLTPGALVADVVTKPPVTPFLARAQALGHEIQTGAAMARAQVAMALERFGITGA